MPLIPLFAGSGSAGGSGPVVQRAQLLPPQSQQPFVFVARSQIAVAAPTAVASRPTVVAQQPLPAQQPYVFIERPPNTAVAAPPDTPARPLVVKPLDAPTTLPEVFIAAVRGIADTPVTPFVVRAVELPWAAPFVKIGTVPVDPPVAAPTIPPRPTFTKGVEQPALGDQKPFSFIAGARVAPPAGPPPDVPPKPVVVKAQDAPQLAGWSWVNQVRTDPVTAPPDVVPPRPTVVTVSSVPAPSQVFTARPVAAESGIVPRPIVATSTVKPPEVAAVITTRPWGPPPPPHRIIQPVVVTDLSLPFRPNGWSRSGHGFAPALPPVFSYGTGNAGSRSAQTGASANTVGASGRSGQSLSGEAVYPSGGLFPGAGLIPGGVGAVSGRSGQLPFGESQIVPFTIPAVIGSDVVLGRAGSALAGSGRTGRG